MSDSPKPISLKRTVFYDEDTGEFCSCEGEFYKTCALRVINQLPCTESIVRISPVIRDVPPEKADKITRSIDKELKELEHALRSINKRFKI